MTRKKMFCDILLLINVVLSTALGSLDSSKTIDKMIDKVQTKMPDVINNLKYNEDADLDTIALVNKYGYQGETHQVTTRDGYILTMHRITGPKSKPDASGKKVVLLMHGLLTSSIDFVILGPEKALAYILADKGYDVWMGNARGNVYSRTHKKYKIFDPRYWMFSWHEIGVEDVPAMIDYVTEKTGRDKMFYIGHSQGTTAFYVMTSERPEYNDKITAMFSYSTVAHVSHTKSPVMRLLSELLDNPLHQVLTLMGSYEFLPSKGFLQKVESIACDVQIISATICKNMVFLVAGFGTNQINMTVLPAILGHTPAGSSARQLVHYSQLIHSGGFRQFDHGIIGNIKNYKKFTPPSYNLSNVKAPVIIYYALNDLLATVPDIEITESKLPNVYANWTIAYEKFAHLDYVWGKDAHELVYSNTIEIMDKFNEAEDNH